MRPTEAAGRWSLVPAVPTGLDRDELAEALADQLLERWGVVFYDLVAAEHPAVRWRELQWALRRMEDRGIVAAHEPSAADPLNLTGVVLPGARVPARATEWFELPV